MAPAIHVDRERVADLCRRHAIRRLSLFGSVLRDDFRPDSDVDVLVEFAHPGRKSFFDLFRIEEELETILGHGPVEAATPGGLSQYFLDEVLDEAEEIFTAEEGPHHPAAHH